MIWEIVATPVTTPCMRAIAILAIVNNGYIGIVWGAGIGDVVCGLSGGSNCMMSDWFAAQGAGISFVVSNGVICCCHLYYFLSYCFAAPYEARFSCKRKGRVAGGGSCPLRGLTELAASPVISSVSNKP
jgi:hypothetical protein